MSDNVLFTAGVATFRAAAHEVTFSGDVCAAQIVHPAYLTGTEGSKTVNEVYTNIVPQATAYGAVSRIAPTGAPYHLVTAASTNVASIKAAAGAIRSVHVFNNGASPVYVKFHNVAVTPTVGNSVYFSVPCQAGVRTDADFGGGIQMSVGIGISVVKDIYDVGVTAVAANEADVLVRYD